jgi:tether containing UBX domain for GLUT4
VEKSAGGGATEQAHVSAPLPVKEKKKEEEPLPKKSITEKPASPESGSPIESEPKKVKTEEMEDDENTDPQPSTSKANAEATKEAVVPKVVEIQDDFPDPVINIIGEREALVYKLESAGKSSLDDLPDDFFEITIDDIRLLYRDLKKKAESVHDAPLLTAKLREQEQQEKITSKIVSYKQTVIRIQFPDRIVLQGIFEPQMNFSDVKSFVKQFLADPSVDFHLCT